jgi:hypothetical protein
VCTSGEGGGGGGELLKYKVTTVVNFKHLCQVVLSVS